VIPKSALRTVRELATKSALLVPGPLVVAVSGGTDSTALLLLLAALRDERGLVLHVAHFDHRTRPRAAAADAAYVADLAARCGATIRVGRADVAPTSEDQARRLRYAFLRRAAAAYGATAIATGHTRDDQAETVLLHLARGSGLAGLAAMRPSREGIVRPLLTLARADTAAVCAAAGITPREDPTNRSLAFARNRVRRRVLPELAAINPRIVNALARFADAAAADEDELERAAARLLEASRADGGDGAGLAGAIDLDVLGGGTLAERALALAWSAASGRALAARHRAALLLEASRRAGSASLDLPGGRAVREYGLLRFVAVPASRGAPSSATVPASRGVPERAGAATSLADPAPAAPRDEPVPLRAGTPVDWRGWRILVAPRAGRAGGPEAGAGRADARLSGEDAAGWPLIADVHLTAVPGLVVRARRPGDRLAGTVRTKVQDVLTDAKVPTRLRDAVPLVVDAAGAVRWVVGLAAAAPGSGAVRLFARPPRSFGLPGIISGRPALHGLASSYGSRARPARPREESGHESR